MIKKILIVSTLAGILAAAVYAGGFRCSFCNGTGFSGNTNCAMCKGTGRNSDY